MMAGVRLWQRTNLNINMKHKNLIEISDDMLTALVLVHKKNRQVDFAVAKGEPHLLEMMTLLFGVFTAMVKSLDNIEVDGHNGGQKVREMFRHHSLEDCREILAMTSTVFQQLAKKDKGNE